MNLGLCQHCEQPSRDDVKSCTLLAGSRDTTLKLWNPSTCEVMQTLSGHKYQVTCRSTHAKDVLLGMSQRQLQYVLAAGD